MQLKKLEKELKRHDDLYYNKDNPEISDIEYNALKKKYLELTNQEEYSYVPGEALFQKCEHSQKIKSLAKVNSLEDLKIKMKELAPFVIQPKLDGLTLVGYPGTETGRGKFITRGNGSIGEDVFKNALKIKDINKVSKSIDVPVRMEVIMPKSEFERINKLRDEDNKFKNPRNAAAGMLRNDDQEKVNGLSYYAYNIVGSILTEQEQLERLKYHNFNVVECFINKNGSIVYEESDIEFAIEQISNFDRDALDYDIDGLVIKSNIPNAQNIFGETSHHPKNMIAFKFETEEAETTLIDIVFQAGRTGKITPVAILSPIELLGSTVSRATLHNKNIMDILEVRKNAKVTIVKANDIIPAIINSKGGDELIEFPDKCPECGSLLKLINDQHFCQNEKCKAKLRLNICHLAKREALDIEGLSISTADKIIDAGIVENAFDIFNLKVNDILQLDGFAKKSSEKLIYNINKAKEVSLKQFLYATGIPLIGRTVSSDIADSLLSIENIIEDINNGCDKIKSIDGVGSTIIESINSNKHLIIDLLKYVKPKNSILIKKNEAQLTFVLTGTMSKPRKEYENIIKNAGHKISSSVSKNTNYVCAGEDAGSKLKKAQDLGIKIIDENELLEVINA